MTIQEFKQQFKHELSDLYSESEIQFLNSIFIEHYLGLNQFQQRNSQDLIIKKDKEQELLFTINELKTGRPYQHILGETEFYGMKFFVNENVLVPRPETEELLEIAISKIKELEKIKDNLSILDIGTGSGVIPLVLKKHFPNAKVTSIDYSEKALEVARKNAEFHNLAVDFIWSDYLQLKLNADYDVIISNPPYIGIEEEIDIDNSVKDFEPKMALFSPTEDALIFYRKIAEDARTNLQDNGWVFLEINQLLGPETLDLYTSVLKNAELIKDLSSNDRFVIGSK